MAHDLIILDTNVISYIMKNDPLAASYLPHIEGQLAAVAFITVGELHFGAEKEKWGEKRRKNLEQRLQKFIVVNYDNEVAHCYGRLYAERQKAGREILHNDAWIAACAVRHNIPLLTHNAKDFSGISSLKVITENNMAQ